MSCTCCGESETTTQQAIPSLTQHSSNTNFFGALLELVVSAQSKQSPRNITLAQPPRVAAAPHGDSFLGSPEPVFAYAHTPPSTSCSSLYQVKLKAEIWIMKYCE